MGKINQIQQRLLELDGGAFQKLADSYLLKKGYPQINPIGSVIASNKVKKGTPDTLIPLSNGKYIFAEYTTQEGNVFKKLNDDIKKCFDKKKTGIPIEKIQELVLCHTTELSPKELESLRIECEKHRVNLNVFGMGAISNDLLVKYPGIARDYLSVEVDTGQIVPVDEFITYYGRNKLAARLDTAFHFREEEIKGIETALEKGDLVIISGHAGIGKSRLALECCEKFSQKHTSCKVQCIFDKGADLFKDLRVHFSEPGEFLIFVDDANRISGFRYFIDLLQDRRSDRQIKLIATVRDYALDSVREFCLKYGDPFEINLQPLSEKQVEQLVEEECGFKNHLDLEQINKISQGNPRLAIMAAEIAKGKNTIESIRDASELYDQYYRSMRMDLQELNDPNILKVAGIVAFFGSVDRSYEELMTDIANVFAIAKDDFWNAGKILHNMEIFDMYENEVLKTSDQVLATYLFYLVFFENEQLGFGLILNHFFPRFRQKLVDAINPVLNIFKTEIIIEKMRPHVDQVWDRLRNKDNKDDFLQLVEVFWFIKETETLLYFKAQIESMKASTTEISNIKFESGSSTYCPPILEILSQFKYSEVNKFKIALGLIFEYLTKQPDEVPIVLCCIIERFGFEFNVTGFHVQKLVIERLWAKAEDGKNILFSKLFIAVAEKYLHTIFSQSKFDKWDPVRIIAFALSANALLIELRTTIWDHLFQLWQISSFQEDLWNFLYRHSIEGTDVSVKDIIEQDKVVVLPFLEKVLDISKFWHCYVGQGYLNLLSHLDITFETGLRDRFQNDSYNLYQVMLPNRAEERELEISYTEYQKIKSQRLREVTRNYGFEDYTHFFEQCIEINLHLHHLEEDFFKEGVLTFFDALSERDSDLYEKVLMEYLNRQDFLNLGPYSLVDALIAKCGCRNSYDVLTNPTYPSRRKWIFCFYQCLPPDAIKPEHLKEVYDLYCKAEVVDYLNNLDFLLNYQALDKKIVARVAAIILDRAKDEPAQISALYLLFNPNTEINKVITNVFLDDIDLLERLYIEADRAKTNLDHRGSTFSKILDIDPTFSDRYIEEIFKRKKIPSRDDSSRDYSFIWRREDFDKVMSRITQKIFELEQENFFTSYLQVFFGVDRKAPHDVQILEKQDRFIKRLIEEKNSDIEFMKFLFKTISYFAPERREAHIAHFIKFNNNFEDFEKLSLEPNGWSCWGSAVPVLQRKIDYFESLAALFNTVDFLKHKLYIQQEIKGIREESQWEKKKDFTNEL